MYAVHTTYCCLHVGTRNAADTELNLDMETVTPSLLVFVHMTVMCVCICSTRVGRAVVLAEFERESIANGDYVYIHVVCCLCFVLHSSQ